MKQKRVVSFQISHVVPRKLERGIRGNMLKANKCYCAFFFSLIIAFSTILVIIILEITQASKCHHPEILETDELQIGNKSFSKRDFGKINETHFSICLEKKVPVLRKCCEEGKILRVNEKKRSISCVNSESHFETALEVYDENSQPLPEYKISNFYRQYGLSSCPNKKYLVDLKGENFTFHSDGTLMKNHNRNKTHNSDQFCLDLRDDERLTLVAFICYKNEPPQWELKLYSTGMIISMPFLFAIFLSHALIKQLRTLKGVYLMCHTASLLAFYIFLAIGQINGKGLHPIFCKICGYAAQFWFHAAFFWLHIMTADMWWSLKSMYTRSPTNNRLFNVKRDLKRFLLCCCYGWGGPGIILCISLIMDFHPDIPNFVHKPNIGKDMCLINTESNRFSALYYLYGPMGIIIISNLYFFISTAVNIFLRKKNISNDLNNENSCCNQKDKKQFVTCLKLFIIMGLTWLLELLSWVVGGPKYIWYIPDFSNTLQGLYIFMAIYPGIEKKILKEYDQVRSRYTSNSTRSSSIGRSHKNSSSVSTQNHNENKSESIKLSPIKCNSIKMNSPDSSLLNSI